MFGTGDQLLLLEAMRCVLRVTTRHRYTHVGNCSSRSFLLVALEETIASSHQMEWLSVTHY